MLIGYETTQTNLVTSTYSDKFAIYQTSTSNIVATTDANHTILIGGDFSTGTIGIGTLDPDSFIGSNISTTSTKLVVLGKVLANAYTLFTGCHKIILDTGITENDIKEGMIMSAINSTLFDVNNTTIIANISSKLNDKTVFGVYSGKEESITVKYDPEPPYPVESNITITTSNVIVSTLYVNSLGEGGILVSNYAGEIQNGDYITSSPIAGYGALQADDILHSYTVAKCTEDIDWTQVAETIEYNGVIYKCLLVACTYHCG
jgi:hypothetical protein